MLAAYNTLMDPEARRVHDAALQAALAASLREASAARHSGGERKRKREEDEGDQIRAAIAASLAEASNQQ